MVGRGLAVLLVTAALVVPARDARAESGLWTSSCIKQGRVLYRERFAAKPTPEREAENARRYPGAMCIVLAPDDGAAYAASNLDEALRQSRPGAVPIAASGLDGIGNALGFDAAIRAIRGEAIPVAPASPPPASSAASARPGIEIEAPPEAASVRPASDRYVRLALYDEGSVEDVMADWQRVSTEATELAMFSPSLTRTAEGLTMLSVGPVSSVERKSLCLAAVVLGLDCMPGLSSAPEGVEDALASLERSYPGLVRGVPAPAMSMRAVGLPSPVDGTLSCHASEGFARTKGVDLLALGVGAAPAPAPQRGANAAAASRSSSSSSARTPPSTFRKVLSAKARSLSASAPTLATGAPVVTTAVNAP
jgi:hypothetical protein